MYSSLRLCVCVFVYVCLCVCVCVRVCVCVSLRITSVGYITYCTIGLYLSILYQWLYLICDDCV